MYFRIVFNNKKLGQINIDNVSSFNLTYEYYVSVVYEDKKGLPVVSNIFKSDIYSIALAGRSCVLTEGQEIRTYDATIVLDGKTLGLNKAFSERIENGYIVLSEITGFSDDKRTMYYTDHYIAIKDILRITKTNIESCTVEFNPPAQEQPNKLDSTDVNNSPTPKKYNPSNHKRATNVKNPLVKSFEQPVYGIVDEDNDLVAYKREN